MADARKEMDKVIKQLEKRGVNVNSHMMQDTKGLSDVVEEVLRNADNTREIQKVV